MPIQSIAKLSYNLIAFLAISTAALPVIAQTNLAQWQSQRSGIIEITDKACAGDDDSIMEVHIRLAEDDPVMMNATEWLRENCEPFSYFSGEATGLYQKRSALLGYPVAMGNYGFILLHGERGFESDPATGLEFLNAALEAGYGKSGVYIAEEYAIGEKIPSNLAQARDYLDRAEINGAPKEELSRVERLINEAAQVSGSRSDQSSSESQSESFPKTADNEEARNGYSQNAQNTNMVERAGAAREIKDEIRVITHESDAYSVAYSPDGRYVVVGSADSTARVLDAQDGTVIGTYKGAGYDMFTEGAVIAVAFSNDGDRILTSDPDNIIRMWDVASGQELVQFEGHELMATSLAFHPDGKRMVSGSYDGSVRLWDLRSGKEVKKYIHHEGSGPEQYIHSVEFSPDGKRVLAGGADATVRIWDTDSGEETHRFFTDEEDIGYTNIATYSPDGLYIAQGGREFVRILYSQTGEVLREVDAPTNVKSLDYGPGGEMILLGGDSSDSGVHIFDIAGEIYKTTRRLNEHYSASRGPEVGAIAFSPDGSEAVSIRLGPKISFWGPRED